MGEVENRYSEGSINVRNVDRKFFAQTKLHHRDAVIIKQGNWEETDNARAMINEGASVCLIAYVRDKQSGRLISGHFPATKQSLADESAKLDLLRAKEKYQETNPQKIKLYSEAELDQLGAPYPSWYNKYLSFLERIRDFSQNSGRRNLEAYLFGQSFYLFGTTDQKLKKLIPNLVVMSDVTLTLQNAGLHAENIFDFRLFKGSEQPYLDNTLYTGKGNEILLSRIE